MANTGLRPDEGRRLQYRDVTVVKDEDTQERILEIEVRGKRGVGYCKSMPGAVTPFERLRKRNEPPSPETLTFGNIQRELFNTLLDELGLKIDRDGQRRTAYNLRHTYICMRLMEAEIYQVAKNCRTSVEMIEKYYAAHIKNMLDASAINVRKVRRKIKEVEKATVS
jgi:integrase